jgi:hypothetical protein
MRVRTCVCVCVCVRACSHVYMCMCVCEHIHMRCVRARTHALRESKYTCIHAHTRTNRFCPWECQLSHSRAKGVWSGGALHLCTSPAAPPINTGKHVQRTQANTCNDKGQTIHVIDTHILGASHVQRQGTTRQANRQRQNRAKLS